MAHEIRITRRIAASAAEIYDAWTDPVSVMQWMMPIKGARTSAAIEPRVGGRFHIEFKTDEVTYPHDGEYLRLERPTLIEFSWTSRATYNERSVVTVELSAKGPQETELTLTHRQLPADGVESHRDGWTTIVEQLAGALEGTR